MSLLIDEEEQARVRLYAPANNKLSWKKGKSSLSWYSSFKGAQWKAKGDSVVVVDIPKTLLFGVDVTYFEKGRFTSYTLKNSALRYAKRSYRLARM